MSSDIAMVGRKGLGLGTLTMMLIATQPANALEWELITDNNSGEQTVPDAKAAQPQSDIYVREKVMPGNEHVDYRIQRAAGKANLEKDLTDSVDNNGNISEVKYNKDLQQDRNLEVGIKSKSQRQVKDTLTTINSNANQIRIKEDQIPSADQRENTISERKSTRAESQLKWELVSNNEELETTNQRAGVSTSTIAWELVPNGQEIKVSEYLEENKKQQEIRDKTALQVIEALEKAKIPKWQSKLLTIAKRGNKGSKIRQTDLYGDYKYKTRGSEQTDIDKNVSAAIDNAIEQVHEKERIPEERVIQIAMGSNNNSDGIIRGLNELNVGSEVYKEVQANDGETLLHNGYQQRDEFIYDYKFIISKSSVPFLRIRF